jgi:hypothetical protein
MHRKTTDGRNFMRKSKTAAGNSNEKNQARAQLEIGADQREDENRERENPLARTAEREEPKKSAEGIGLGRETAPTGFSPAAVTKSGEANRARANEYEGKMRPSSRFHRTKRFFGSDWTETRAQEVSDPTARNKKNEHLKMGNNELNKTKCKPIFFIKI